MPLYLVRHTHPAERCPAADPQAAALLLAHLSADNARRHGVDIHAEAVIDGQHTLYLIAEAPDQQTIDGFLAPFAQAGTVQTLPASPCEAVVARGGCAPP